MGVGRPQVVLEHEPVRAFGRRGVDRHHACLERVTQGGGERRGGLGDGGRGGQRRGGGVELVFAGGDAFGFQRDGDAPGELFGQLGLGPVETPARLRARPRQLQRGEGRGARGGVVAGADDGEQPDQPSPRGERGDQGGVRAGSITVAQGGRRGIEDERPPRLAGRQQRFRDAVRGELQHRRGRFRLVGVRRGERGHAPVRGGAHDHHEVLEHRGGQLGDLPQPLVQPQVRVLGGGQQPSGLGEEPVAGGGVVPFGDVARYADQHGRPVGPVRGRHRVGGGLDPQPPPVAVVQGEQVPAAAGFLDLGHRRHQPRVAGGVGARVGPPRVRRRVGQALGPVAEDRGERVVDLHDLPGGVHDEEPVLQGGDQAASPARFFAAQRGQRERRPDAGEQVGGGERLDQVVVGARGQPLGRGLLTGAGREDDHRKGGQRRIRAQGREQGEPVELGHHHVGQQQVGRVRARGGQRGGPVARPP